jgi:hypothetical protein
VRVANGRAGGNSHGAEFLKLGNRLEAYFKKELRVKGKAMWDRRASALCRRVCSADGATAPPADMPPVWWDFVTSGSAGTPPPLAKPVRLPPCTRVCRG